MCDIFDSQAAKPKEEFGGTAATYRDFRRVIESPDVDAVRIATPDHWHAIPAVMAWQVTYEYPGFAMSYETINTNSFGSMGRLTPGMNLHGARGKENRPNGMAFYGSNGTVIADRLGYEALPEAPPRPNE